MHCECNIVKLWPTDFHLWSYNNVACNCNGLSNRCYFDAELFRRTGHGGHCTDCRDNTFGPNCERCKEFFYRRTDSDRCRPCNCHPVGKTLNAQRLLLKGLEIALSQNKRKLTEQRTLDLTALISQFCLMQQSCKFLKSS